MTLRDNPQVVVRSTDLFPASSVTTGPTTTPSPEKLGRYFVTRKSRSSVSSVTRDFEPLDLAQGICVKRRNCEKPSGPTRSLPSQLPTLDRPRILKPNFSRKAAASLALLTPKQIPRSLNEGRFPLNIILLTAKNHSPPSRGNSSHWLLVGDESQL